MVRVRLGLVVVGRCCWGPGITNDSPEFSRTALVDIYRLRCLVAYGGGFRAVLPAMAHLNLELDDNFSLAISNDPTLFSLYKSSCQHLELQPAVRPDLRGVQDDES